MGSYRSSAGGQDRVKAAAGVILVHAALAAIIVSGLNVRLVTEQVERLKTFDINDPPPPPREEPPPPPRPAESAAKDEAAPANVKSKPTPVVAPPPKIVIPVPPPIRTATVKGPEGLDRTAGASVPGPGTGAGGQGSGFGGGGSGGSGSGSGNAPARLLNKIPDRDYRRIAGGRLPHGSAGIGFRVNPDGRASNCRIIRSSGDPIVDSVLCAVAMERLRFAPARDSRGRPIAQDLSYFPRWWLGG